MVRRILKSPVSIATIVAALFYFSRVSSYLPLGKETTLAASWLGLNGEKALLAPIWGEIVRLFGHSPNMVVGLGYVSAFFGVAAVFLFALSIDALMVRALGKSEEKAIATDLKYHKAIWLISLCASLTFAFIPGISLWATHLSPFTLQLALALVPFAILVVLTHEVSSLVHTCLVALAGFFASLAAFEGVSGIVIFPLTTVLVAITRINKSLHIARMLFFFFIGAIVGIIFSQGNALSLPHLITTIAGNMRNLRGNWLFPGMIWALALSVLPVCVVYQTFSRRIVKSRNALGIICTSFCVVAAACLLWDLFADQREYGKAADTLVKRALEQMGERKWLISDGALDDIVLLRKPSDVHLITLKRRFDIGYGEELAKLAKEAFPEKTDLHYAAELGPFEFLRTWSETDAEGMAKVCYSITAYELGYGLISPDYFGWKSADELSLAERAEKWRKTWVEFEPLLKSSSEPGSESLRRRFAVQGNTIGAMAAAAKDSRLAWEVLTFADENIYSGNLSVLLNLVGLINNGEASFVDKNVIEKIRSRFAKKVSQITGQNELRYEIAVGGRVFIDPVLREQILAMQKAMAKNIWETPFGKRLNAALDGMHEIETLKGAARAAKIDEMERTILPQLRAQPGADWAKWWTLGEFYYIKGREGFVQARVNFRNFIKSGHSEAYQVFDRLLELDFASNDPLETEYDALLILRIDIRHKLANAVLGSMRLERKNYESAVHYLKRAIDLGNTMPGVLNDYAIALSGLGKHEEAEKAIRSLLEDYPNEWNLLDTLGLVLRAAGKKAESEQAFHEATLKADEANELPIYKRILRERL